MADGPDLDGMINDAQFLSLAPAGQRLALSQLTGDKTFDGLSDGDTLSFVSRMKLQTSVPAPVPQELQGQSLQQRFPIVPKQGEDFSQTMQRAAQAGKTVTPEELQGQAVQGLKMAPAVLAGAGAIGAGGAAALAGPGEVPNAVNAAATAALPHVKALGEWAMENPRLAKALVEIIKGSSIGAGYAGTKKILDIATTGSK